MSELALVVWTFFTLGIGLTLMWMWSRLEIFDLHEAHAEELKAIETRIAWLSSYINRLEQELEPERIISDSFAAGIARQER